MSLVGDWTKLQAKLPEGWSRAELRLTTADGAVASRAASLLGPAQPFRAAPGVLRFSSALDGTAPSPDSVARLLRRLDETRIRGRLEVLATTAGAPAADRAETPPPEPVTLLASWDAALATLPPDWSDLYAELRLDSSDYLEPAATLCAPINPRRDGTRLALRFRAARRAGYGASATMVGRCLERCDGMGMQGSVEVLGVLSDTRLVATQGPTWMLAGKNV
ncbi:MAG TPA: hypothetical protein VH538_08995 [Gaiellaceae bacterium]